MDNLISNPDFRASLTWVRSRFNQHSLLCLPMSVCLWAVLESQFKDHSFKIQSGSLLYRGRPIFIQKFHWNKYKDQGEINTTDEMHIWVEADNRYIIDPSLFWTICSDDFNKPYKQEMLDKGARPTASCIQDKMVPNTDFEYRAVEELPDFVIDGVLNGIETQPELYYCKGMHE